MRDCVGADQVFIADGHDGRGSRSYTNPSGPGSQRNEGQQERVLNHVLRLFVTQELRQISHCLPPSLHLIEGPDRSVQLLSTHPERPKSLVRIAAAMEPEVP